MKPVTAVFLVILVFFAGFLLGRVSVRQVTIIEEQPVAEDPIAKAIEEEAPTKGVIYAPPAQSPPKSAAVPGFIKAPDDLPPQPKYIAGGPGPEDPDYVPPPTAIEMAEKPTFDAMGNEMAPAVAYGTSPDDMAPAAVEPLMDDPSRKPNEPFNPGPSWRNEGGQGAPEPGVDDEGNFIPPKTGPVPTLTSETMRPTEEPNFERCLTSIDRSQNVPLGNVVLDLEVRSSGEKAFVTAFSMMDIPSIDAESRACLLKEAAKLEFQLADVAGTNNPGSAIMHIPYAIDLGGQVKMGN